MKKFTKVLSLMLVAALVLGTFAVPAQAATKKKTVKKQSYTSDVSILNKKAATVKKGTTKLTFKGGDGYVKFTAPKGKKYKFTFSNMKSKKGILTAVGIQLKDRTSPAYAWYTKAKTAGGKTDFLNIGLNGKTIKSKKKVDWYLTKRTATIKLKKGDVLYLQVRNAPEKTTCTLNIK
ncbi:MAG: hypothetical protein IJJ25_03140 [Lachnospiraceae bacterium]|nr:hypothetical protein [Lachnospiraceae bacterium]